MSSNTLSGTPATTNQTASRDLQLRIQQLIGSDLAAMEVVFQQEIDSREPYVTDVLTHLQSYRGKRLRPMLLMLTARALGTVTREQHVLAAVVEMIHTATLVHDDVLDDATTRRHVATVNARWNNETSVLLGDYLFTHAFHLAASLESARACRLIGHATNLVCEGELSQVHERGNLNLTEEQYFAIVEGKTAELCAVACHLGALYGGASPETVAACEQYGRWLGIAFQIADDVLDLSGTEAEMGKTLGSDLTKQKLTLPVIHLLTNVPDSEAARIREWLSEPTLESRGLLQEKLRQAGSLEYARDRALEYAAGARERLSVLPESPARSLLEEIADYIVVRKT